MSRSLACTLQVVLLNLPCKNKNEISNSDLQKVTKQKEKDASCVFTVDMFIISSLLGEASMELGRTPSAV